MAGKLASSVPFAMMLSILFVMGCADAGRSGAQAPPASTGQVVLADDPGGAELDSSSERTELLDGELAGSQKVVLSVSGMV